jgi:hypothetical protein
MEPELAIVGILQRTRGLGQLDGMEFRQSSIVIRRLSSADKDPGMRRRAIVAPTRVVR